MDEGIGYGGLDHQVEAITASIFRSCIINRNGWRGDTSWCREGFGCRTAKCTVLLGESPRKVGGFVFFQH